MKRERKAAAASKSELRREVSRLETMKTKVMKPQLVKKVKDQILQKLKQRERED